MNALEKLRERVARALAVGHTHDDCYYSHDWYADADAVIAELQLQELVSYDTPTGNIPPFEFVGDESDLDEALEAYAKAYQIPKVRRWVTPPERVET